ncbi:cyclic nucleotide-binding domain-containing protein [Rhodobacteraceae bacterium NNCM2]|nr:cyclic nucleotide-binding domain-containing protein [Coraliihabitans acroporae]
MNLSEAVHVLQETPLFRKLDPKRLRVVAMMGETLSYRAGERLFEAGEEGDSAFVILSGDVDVIVNAKGKEVVVAVLHQGEIFGEIAALTDQPRTSAIQAQGPLSVLRLDRQTIMNLMREFPDIALQLIRVLADRLKDTSRQLAEVQS